MKKRYIFYTLILVIAIIGVMSYLSISRKQVCQDFLLSDHVYNNNYLGITFDIPKEYTCSSEESIDLTNKQLDDHNMDEIFLFSSIEESTYNSFEVFATRLSLDELIFKDRYISKRISDLEDLVTGLEISELEPVIIDGEQIARLAADYDRIKVSRYIVFRRGYAIEFLIGSKDDKVEEDYIKVVESIKFN